MIKKLIPEVLMVVLLTVSLVFANGTNPVAPAPEKKATVAKSEYCPPCPECPEGKTIVKTKAVAAKTATKAECKDNCKGEKCENTSKK